MATKLKFAYVARDPSGREHKGTMEAETEAEATGRLRQQQLSVVKLDKAVPKGGGMNLSLFSRKAARKCNTGELCLFTRQLATMIGAGIPLLESFEILAEQTRDSNKGFGEGLQECADLVRGGTEMSEAMGRFRGMFPEIYVNMVKAGEASGQLDIILNRLAEFLEASESLKREIKSAMTYPVISLVMILGITGYLLIGVVPKFKTMFDALHGELPAVTKGVLAVSDWLTSNVPTLIGVGIAGWIGLKLALRTRPAQRIRDTLWLKVPVFGPLFQKVAISRFARTFGTLLSSGVPLLGALEIVATTAGNVVIEETLLETRETVRKGESLSTHLTTSWVFPPMVVKMIGIGEKSGALEQLLGKIADFYDEQVHATVKALTSLIEPIMLMVMGAVVGLIVLAIFYPILQLQSAVRGNS
ncbi:MAG: type II secretion system F family protein [Planctomycetes bacterium]|nr:type II secretion system F family protein [Planctomycetota bacterium]